MQIGRNTISSLKRNTIRNLLVGIVLVSLIAATTIAMMVHATTDIKKKEYQDQYGAKVTIQTDMSVLMEQYAEVGRIASMPATSHAIKEALSQSSAVDHSDLIYRSFLVNENLASVGTETVYQPTSNGNIAAGLTPKAQLIGVNNPSIMPGFAMGTRTLVEGTMFTSDGEVIVSEAFAAANKLAVGTTFKAELHPYLPQMNFTITGLFQDKTKTEKKYPDYLNSDNEILMSSNTLKVYSEYIQSDALVSLDATYYLKDASTLEQFIDQAHEIGLDRVYTLAPDAQAYQENVAPFATLQSMTSHYLWYVLPIGALVLLAFSAFNTYRRSNELIVLRTAGMRKSRIIRSYLYESLTLLIVSLSVGLGIGYALAQPATSLLSKVGYARGENVTIVSPLINTAEPMSYTLNLNAPAIINTALISIALVILVSSLGIVYTLYYEPRHMFTERSS
ncbi:FtsX-like permease family protein [Erysipelothrix sp. HDW6C]|uniref:ABC transporter permease n=1 Tax=Erysipelothrix sp. HDW6C TaxID=2714930 RepID=UPI001408FE0F|nr:FtsX-like permease family protein [Erysipelothrix sp. HDW6C]QIK70589.1 FtsX-like permease family protein [Erysipelothrix sp. HDW6C]